MNCDTWNRYLFHWLSPEKLDSFSQKGLLRPYWKHFILEQERFVRGVSLCQEPMLWNPDDGLPREACLIIDREKIDCTAHIIDSSQAYHLTKAVLRANRRKEDIGDIIGRALASRRRCSSRPDEFFVEGAINIDWVVAVGYEIEDDGNASPAMEAARRFAEANSIPMLDMSGWVVSAPGYRETDGCVDEVRAEATARRTI